MPLIEAARPDAPLVGPVVIMTDPANMPALAADSPLAGALCYEDLLAAEDDGFVWPRFDETTAAVLCYTSGTTGDPKGVLYSHRAQVLHAFATALPDTFGLAESESVMPVVPMFHVNAWGVPYAAPLTGTRLVMPGPRLDGASLAELIDSEGVTLSLGVPTVWLGLLNHLRESGRRLPTLRRLVIGGAATPRSMIEGFQTEFGIEVRVAWGMTEMTPLGTVNTLKAKHRALPEAERVTLQTKAGRVIFGVEMKVVDDHGNTLPRDGKSAGQLKVRGPWVCNGYYRLDHSAAHDAEGWFATGDVATLDSDGFMQITDRSKDMIKSGGEWISSIELENFAMGHPEVLQAAAIGVPDEKWGERPILIVVPRPGTAPEPASILGYFEGRLPKWCIPDRVEVVDSLPLGATGKVLKARLRERFGSRPAAAETGGSPKAGTWN